MKKLLAILALAFTAQSAGPQGGDITIGECLNNLSQEQKALVVEAKKEMNECTNQDGTVNEAKMEQLKEQKQERIQECGKVELIWLNKIEAKHIHIKGVELINKGSGLSPEDLAL